MKSLFVDGKLTLVAFTCVAFSLFSPTSSAQEFRATVQGTVSDNSGGAIPGAAVTLVNNATGVENRTTTNASGLYVFQFLQPGRYKLSTTSDGFKTQVQDGIVLSLGQNQRIDVTLELGAVTETIEVSGNVSLIQTEESSSGATIEADIKDNLPLKGRSSLFMFTLAPGVVNNRYGEDTRPNDTITNVLFSANGSPVASGDVSVDGAINTVNVNRAVNISQWVPAVDAVGEFKLQTGILPAEYGRSGGSFMNIVIKTGTNEFHGSVYEYFRNSYLDANTFFGRGQGQDLAAFGANTYGATVGGPIVKNKSFFFFSYEGAREGNALNVRRSVPTTLMRQGDFSELGGRPIYDPFSVATVNGVSTRNVFANNFIPESLRDPVGRNILSYYPDANTTPPNPDQPWVNNFTFSGKWPRNYDSYVAKVNHQFNSSWNMFLRYNQGTGQLIFPHEFDGIASPGRNVVDRPHQGFSMGNTFVINPSTTMDIRLGYSWGKEQRRPWSEGFDLSSLGFSPNFVNDVQSAAFPRVSASGFINLANSEYLEQPGYTWSLQPSASLVRGRHLIKIGFEGRLLYGNFFSNGTPAGNFSFSNSWTNGPSATTPSSSSGFPIASMLVGLGGGDIPTASGVSILNKYYAGYVQDDYKASSKLTLNLGLRYSYEAPSTERYNRATRQFCYACASPLQVPGMDLRGGLTFVGIDGNPRAIYDADKNNFAPRIGIAYRLRDNLVLRTGYALYYIPVIGSVLSPGFDSDTPWVTSQDGVTPLNTLQDPFPNGHLPITGSSEGLLTRVGQSVTFLEPQDRTPMFHTWTFNIQRSFSGQGLIEVAYVGSRGIDLATDQAQTGFRENINQLPPQYLTMGAALNESVDNPFFGLIESGALAGLKVQRKQLLRPFPQFLDILRDSPAYGNSAYHALQAKYQKRMASGLTALVSYTWSKNMGDIFSPQNNYDRQAERSISSFDATHRLTTTFAYEMPFGRGRKYLNGLNGVTDAFVGGWQISMFNTFQSGFPLGFSTSPSTIFGVGEGAQRPNAAGDPQKGISGGIGDRLDRYFNEDAFAQPANFTFGNLSPRISSLRTPGMNNFNLTLAKKVKIGDTAQVEFRVASYNLLNHPVFSGPNTTLGNVGFGTINNTANLPRQTEFMLRITY